MGVFFVIFVFMYPNYDINDVGNEWIHQIVASAVTKTSKSLYKLFLLAIGANFMVCLSVFLSYNSHDVTSKTIMMWFPILTFVALGFEHSVANMFTIFAGVMYGAPIPWYNILFYNFPLVILGNFIGGAILLGLLMDYTFVFRENHKNYLSELKTCFEKMRKIRKPKNHHELGTLPHGLEEHFKEPVVIPPITSINLTEEAFEGHK